MILNQFTPRLSAPEIKHRTMQNVPVGTTIIREFAPGDFRAVAATVDGVPRMIGSYPTPEAASDAIVAALDPVITIHGTTPEGEPGSLDLFWDGLFLANVKNGRCVVIPWTSSKDQVTISTYHDDHIVVDRADLEAIYNACPWQRSSVEAHMEDLVDYDYDPYYRNICAIQEGAEL